jgi:putative ABC transport system permease protein
VNVRDSIRIAVRAMRANRLRSGLTMLGLSIGVGAVILLVAVGNGAQQAINGQLEELGTNSLSVFTRGRIGPNSTGTHSRRAELTLDDVKALRRRGESAGIRTVVPVLNPPVTFSYRGTSYSPLAFAGTSPSYLVAQNYGVARGRLFSAADDRERRRVMLVGQTVVKEVFNGRDPIGKEVGVNGSRFEVIGVLEARGGDVVDDDDIAIAPFGAVESNLTGPNPPLGSIVVQATSRQTTGLAQREVHATLLAAHHIDDPKDVDFDIFNSSLIREVADTTARILTFLLAGVAGISLLVGGIGVMNIMLVTVTERTREIGIRKAIGARRSHIVGQFLLEALVLSMLGGGAGVVVGVGLGQLGSAEFQPHVSPTSVIVAFSVSVMVGLFFGLYPANRAAALRPIDALRYE